MFRKNSSKFVPRTPQPDRVPLLDPSTDPESPPSPSTPVPESKEVKKYPSPSSVKAAWWAIGILNNISFVIMAASAKSILPDSVGVVYLANSFPSLLIRLSAPYWFDAVGYRARMSAGSLLWIIGFTLVAVGPDEVSKLLGVMLVSAQCGLGETSMLALSTRYEGDCLTYWSSGTGAAGILGYAYVVGVDRLLGIGEVGALLGGNIFGAMYFLVFRTFTVPDVGEGEGEGNEKKSRKMDLTTWERLRLTLSLWPWGVPLILVYFAEYAMQAGTWSAIGFPVTSKAARDDFYQNANWSYQLGVLISRSSGTIWRPDLPVLWIMPILQCVFLVMSTINGVEHWWYDQSLLASAVCVGFLGGAVYVNGFRLIGESINPELNELATAAAAVSCDIGTNFGELVGVFIQKYLYEKNGIHD